MSFNITAVTCTTAPLCHDLRDGVSAEGGAAAQYTLARDYSITVNVSMAPMSVTWMLIK